MSAASDSDYLIDGLTDEIIRNLAVTEGLEVRSRTSSFAFKDKPRNLRDIGEQLGVNLIVEGSIMRSGSRLQINAQLVQVAGDVPLWAERFDRELKDIFAIQDEISRAIVNTLALTPGNSQRRYDTNLKAYELYLKARELVDRRSAFPAQQAVKLFEQAIASDPSFALGYAGLAEAYAAASTEIQGPFRPAAIPPETALALMGPAAETALRLDPLLAEAHAAMGLLLLPQAGLAKGRGIISTRHRAQPKSHANLYQLCALDACPAGKAGRSRAAPGGGPAHRSAVIGRASGNGERADHGRIVPRRPSPTSNACERSIPTSLLRTCYSRGH